MLLLWTGWISCTILLNLKSDCVFYFTNLTWSQHFDLSINTKDQVVHIFKICNSVSPSFERVGGHRKLGDGVVHSLWKKGSQILICLQYAMMTGPSSFLPKANCTQLIFYHGYTVLRNHLWFLLWDSSIFSSLSGYILKTWRQWRVYIWHRP